MDDTTSEDDDSLLLGHRAVRFSDVYIRKVPGIARMLRRKRTYAVVELPNLSIILSTCDNKSSQFSFEILDEFAAIVPQVSFRCHCLLYNGFLATSPTVEIERLSKNYTSAYRRVSVLKVTKSGDTALSSELTSSVEHDADPHYPLGRRINFW